MAQAVQVEALWSGLTNNSGQPLAGGKVQVYFAGTTTPVSLYTAADKSTSATNPIILDGYGRAQVWADGKYRFVVKDSADVTLYTLDNVLYGFDDSQLVWGGTSAGTGNVVTVTAPSVTQYDDGQRLCFIAASTNSGPVTVNVNGLGAVSVVKGPSAVPLVSGDLLAGQVVNLTYQVVGGVGRYRLDSYPTVADIQGQLLTTATSVAGTNAITGTLTPTPTQYVTGQVIRFKAVNTNTAAVTAQFIPTLAALAVQRYGAALVGGEIKANDMVELVYDGTQFQLVNSVPAPLFLDRTNNRVGIGTTAPQYSIDVQNTDGLSQSLTRYSANANSSLISFRKSRGATVGTNTIVNSGDGLGAIYFEGANGTGFVPAAAITATVGGTPGATNDMPGQIEFSTCADGSGSLTERMRIAPDGQVRIGNTTSRQADAQIEIRKDIDGAASVSVQNASSGSTANSRIILGTNSRIDNAVIFSTSSTWPGAQNHLFINSNNSFGGISFGTQGSARTGIDRDGNVVPASANAYRLGFSGYGWAAVHSFAWVTESDRRIKNSVAESELGLNFIKALRPVSYKLNLGGYDVTYDENNLNEYGNPTEIRTPKPGARQHYGFIAQEVRGALGDIDAALWELADKEDPNSSQSLKITEFIAPIVKAIQELSAKVDSLEAKLAGK